MQPIRNVIRNIINIYDTLYKYIIFKHIAITNGYNYLEYNSTLLNNYICCYLYLVCKSIKYIKHLKILFCKRRQVI